MNHGAHAAADIACRHARIAAQDGRSTEVFRDGNFEISFVAKPTNGGISSKSPSCCRTLGTLPLAETPCWAGKWTLSIGLRLRPNGWARARNHDEFWAYRASLLAFIGQGAGEALDVGCGEGRVSRVLKECGYRVTAIDPIEQLISAAEQAGSADVYKIAAAAELPFENCSFDLAVAYNVLMDIDDSSAEGN